MLNTDSSDERANGNSSKGQARTTGTHEAETNTGGNLMPSSSRSIHEISNNPETLALGRQTQARIQAYELPTFRPVLADKQRCCQLQ